MKRKIIRKIKNHLKRYKHFYAFLKWGKATLKRWKHSIRERRRFNRECEKIRRTPSHDDEFAASLKDIHKGCEFYIIADGASLKPEELENLQQSGAVTIGVGTVFTLFDRTAWRPDYYACGGTYGKDDYRTRAMSELFNSKSGGSACDADESNKEQSVSDSFNKFTKMIPMVHFEKWYTYYTRDIVREASLKQPRTGLYPASTLVVELANYMGAAAVHMLGVDYNFMIPMEM